MRIPGIPEPVELVKSFEELREGMVVYLKPCSWCDGCHRGMLMPASEGPGRVPSGELVYDPAFALLPPVHLDPGEIEFRVSARATRQLRVYRVIDEEITQVREQVSIGTTAERTRKKVRT